MPPIKPPSELKQDDPSYDSSDWHEAMKRAMLWGDEIPIGKFFQRTDLPSLDQAEPILDQGGPLAHRVGPGQAIVRKLTLYTVIDCLTAVSSGYPRDS